MAEVPLLRATDITKSYAGVQALKSASLELRAGEAHALIGENGAGKSTLIKIITGAVEPDGGGLQIEGKTVTHNSPRVAKALGVAAIYQQPALFPELTVAENIALGVEQAGMAGRVDWGARRRRAAELLAQVGARIDPDAEAGDLTMPQQQLVQMMVGRELSAVFPKREVALGDVVLELRDLGCKESGVRGVNLSVRAGEIVGLAGLVGAGRTELARAVFGLTPADEGEIRLRGERVRIKSPAE